MNGSYRVNFTQVVPYGSWYTYKSLIVDHLRVASKRNPYKFG